MQLLTCPFCGARSESEFHFGGDLGNLRPEGGADVPAETWANYLYFRNNKRGAASEVWMHMTCGELFRMDRDTVDNGVIASAGLGEGHQ